jgi:hypothetical protein
MSWSRNRTTVRPAFVPDSTCTCTAFIRPSQPMGVCGTPNQELELDEGCTVLNRPLALLLVTLLSGPALSAQGVEARFTTGKENYIAREPIFVALTVSNNGNKPVWIDLNSPAGATFPLFCEDFAFEVPGAESAPQQWGCGFAGSCGHGFREVLPGKSLSLRQLVNSQFRLQPGAYAFARTRPWSCMLKTSLTLLKSPSST